MASAEVVRHEAAAALMRQAALAISKDIDGRLREHRLTLVQRRALAVLSEARRVTPGELSLALDVDASGTTRLLDRLVAKGMCHRDRDDGDRRQVHLEITGLGRSALEVTRGAVSDVLAEWFSGVGGSELEVLNRALSTMLAARRNRPPAVAPEKWSPLSAQATPATVPTAPKASAVRPAVGEMAA